MEAYRWALGQTGLKSPEKFVLVMLADHYNEKAFRAWPSIERLAVETGLHRTSVIRALKGLQTVGLVQIERWGKAGDGGRLTNRYCLPAYDPRSTAARRQPVSAYDEYGPDGGKLYDATPHYLSSGEEVPGYAF